MLTTGVRTPVGIKVFGEDLNEIERVSIALEGMLRQVPGTRSTFAERQTGREYVDIVPNREAIALRPDGARCAGCDRGRRRRMQVSTAIAGRARFSINLRYAADRRSDPQALRRILVPVQSSGSVADFGGAGTGAGASAQSGGMRRLHWIASRWRYGFHGWRRIEAVWHRRAQPLGHRAHSNGWCADFLTCLSSGGSRARPFRSESWPTSGWSRVRR